MDERSGAGSLQVHQCLPGIGPGQPVSHPLGPVRRAAGATGTVLSHDPVQAVQPYRDVDATPAGGGAAAYGRLLCGAIRPGRQVCPRGLPTVHVARRSPPYQTALPAVSDDAATVVSAQMGHQRLAGLAAVQCSELSLDAVVRSVRVPSLE